MEPILDHQSIRDAGDEPSTQWSYIVRQAVEHRVSDIHLAAQKLGGNLMFRIDGRLYPQTQIDSEAARRLIGHVQSIAGMDVAEHRKPHEGRLKPDLPDRAVDLRISVVPTLHGQDMVVRVFDRSIGLMDIDELGLLENQRDVIDDIIERPNGLILVSGPTGSGKTTTMYSMLRMIAGAGRKICTIENPIEYDLNGVSQTQISPRVGLGFAEMLTALLRQDPDVIMVGEIRDAETARTAVRAANTGHLVLATTHASRASRAIETLLFLDVHPFFLATALRCVIAQVLVRTICPECRTELPETAPMPIEPKVRELLTDADEAHLSQGEGCQACHQSGYQGRMGVFELFVPDETTRQMILNRAPAGDIDEYIDEAETLSLTDVGKLAALRGRTTIEEIVSVLPNL
jgi:type II secretory ATPase GspE/PulE/Tfp pilus assembly ATPase PilB-like protein